MNLFCHWIYLPDGWCPDIVVEIDETGDIRAVRSGQTKDADEAVDGPVIPGIPNLHSHAFQRAMAGLAEVSSGGEDNFWSWRRAMYALVSQLSADDIEAIATWLYIEMLKAGYTSVGEFHYLHHDPRGQPYADPAHLSHTVIGAATTAGIGITHLPVLYGHGGFGGRSLADSQRRFGNSPDKFLTIVSDLVRHYAKDSGIRIGIAPHSLRAVTPESLGAVLQGYDQLNPGGPVHIHVAEQVREVEECIAWSGMRPVAWLLDQQPVGPRWCLVHATHVDAAEATALARCGAVAGLCPTTEANLGDGLFPAPAFLENGGRIGIGSDSQISVSPVEELRWLEYGQRLTARKRNVLARVPGQSTGRVLFDAVTRGGAQALGRQTGRLALGFRADLVVLDTAAPILCELAPDHWLDAFVFCGNVNTVRHVMCGGRWVVRDFRHDQEDVALRRFRNTLSRLRDAS